MEKFSPTRSATSDIHSSGFRSGCPASSIEEIFSPSYESSSIFLTGSCADCRAAIGPDDIAQRMRKSSARSKRCRKCFFFPQLLDTMHRQSFVREKWPHDVQGPSTTMPPCSVPGGPRFVTDKLR